MFAPIETAALVNGRALNNLNAHNVGESSETSASPVVVAETAAVAPLVPVAAAVASATCIAESLTRRIDDAISRVSPEVPAEPAVNHLSNGDLKGNFKSEKKIIFMLTCYQLAACNYFDGHSTL